MPEKLYLSAEKGYHYVKPFCFRCGDCCTRCPPGVTQAEIDLIRSRLNVEERKIFEVSLTTDPKLADPIEPVQATLSKGVAWIKAPRCFLDWEWERKTDGKNFRTFCRIYKFRPEICRIFHCGKQRQEEPLITAKFKFEMTFSFREYLKAEILKTSGEEEWKKTEKLIKEAEQTEKRQRN